MGFSATSSFQAGNTSSLVERIRGAAAATAQSVGGQVLQQAQVIVPVDTGELYNSGNLEVVEEGEAVTAYVNFDAGHAGYVEFGTFKMGAQPYLRPAMDASKLLLFDTAKNNISAVL